MENIPSFTTTTWALIVVANVVIVVTILLLAGPPLLRGVDIYGRPLEQRIWGRIALLLLVGLTILLFNFQTFLIVRSMPTFFSEPARIISDVDRKELLDNPNGEKSYFIWVDNHRFAVSEEIYNSILQGDQVEIFYRVVDDALVRIETID